jgi:hypothetical protein
MAVVRVYQARPLTSEQNKSEIENERQPAQEVRYEAFASSTLERVPQSVVQVVGE